MLQINVPDSPGLPLAWTLFWFAVALGLYGGLVIWFWRVLRRETRDPETEAPHDGQGTD